jgi:hypothetical protein
MDVVSTVSENYYREHISSPLQTLDTLLDIECADGQQLPYIGYTEIQFQLLAKPMDVPFA